LIVGGHEHFPITATENRTLISKAGSDAKFVARIGSTGGACVRIEYQNLGGAAARRDRAVLRAHSITSAAGRRAWHCGVVMLRSSLGRSSSGRRHKRERRSTESPCAPGGETNLGNLVADAMRADAGAESRDCECRRHPRRSSAPGRALTRRTLEELRNWELGT